MSVADFEAGKLRPRGPRRPPAKPVPWIAIGVFHATALALAGWVALGKILPAPSGRAA